MHVCNEFWSHASANNLPAVLMQAALIKHSESHTKRRQGQDWGELDEKN